MTPFTINDTIIEVVRGSVTDQDVDAIVNAANTSMRGGGGIDGRIHRSAGPSMMEELIKVAPHGAKTGTVVVTGGHNLKQKFVFHTPGPVWHGGTTGEAELLASCYRSCVDAADRRGLESIAYCSISTGAYGYPIEQAAPIAVETVKAFVQGHPETPLRRVVFAMYGESEFDVFCRAFKVPHYWGGRAGDGVSIFDQLRLPASTFKLDVDRMRRGWYSDKYFHNIVILLEALDRSGYKYGGHNTALTRQHVDLSAIDTGNVRVEMQYFTRRSPFTVVVGVDKALAILKESTGYLDGDKWVSTTDRLEVSAVHDGFMAAYKGDPREVVPVLRIRGRYRDFAPLETPTLGCLTRGSRVATNVYEVLEAARGKEVLFFPARFDAHEVQAADGYAYHIAVELFNRTHGHAVTSAVSTDEQGDWWGGAGGGTVAHAAIACFLGDTAETVLRFAEHLPGNIPRIALVDFNNDCIGDSLATMKALFIRYMELTVQGKDDEARKYILYGVRPDTSASLIDKSVEPLGDRKLDRGVNARLVFKLRREIDHAYERWDVPFSWLDRAKEYCRNVKITVTGGFTPEKIRDFEENGVPADVYGVGSYLFSNSTTENTNNDFTADIVRVEIDGAWHDMAKVGRAACDNPALVPVDWKKI